MAHSLNENLSVATDQADDKGLSASITVQWHGGGSTWDGCL